MADVETAATGMATGSGINTEAATLSVPEHTKPHAQTQALRADLIGSTTCSAAGITATGHAPVLVLCRRLLAAGLNPDRALEVYRGAVLALRVRSIGEAARLTVRESTSDGRPRFVRLTNGDGCPPMRFSEPAPADPWTTWPDATVGAGQ